MAIVEHCRLCCAPVLSLSHVAIFYKKCTYIRSLYGYIYYIALTFMQRHADYTKHIILFNIYIIIIFNNYIYVE